MAKGLGQIHTVSHEWDNINYPLAAQNRFLVDLPGQLTSQLQHMVRMMSSFKVVGIDMAYGPIVNSTGISCSMSGQLKYYAPTVGRVKALQAAYKTVRDMMHMSGVNPSNAITYDFRPPLSDPAGYSNGSEFFNQASIEDNGLASCLHNGPAGSSNIFSIYTQGILPRQSYGVPPNFQVGYAIGLRSNATSADWTLNEGVLLDSLVPTASHVLEMIPFELSYSAPDQVGGITQIPDATTFQWRPDPALYLSILTGQIQIEIEESSAFDEAGVSAMDETQLDIAVHVAGWKSILGSGKKRRSKKGKKSHGRRRSKK